jgi:hypothetical protein
MFIVYGTRGKVLQGPPKRQFACPACGGDVHSTSGVLRWFHVFWIPLFPTMKLAAVECQGCHRALRGGEIPERVRKEVEALVFTRGRVLPRFAGLLAIAAFAAFVGVGAAAESSREASWLAAPAVGDAYVVKLDRFGQNTDAKYPWGIARVASVEGDRLDLRVGKYAYSDRGVARRAVRHDGARPEAYAAATLTVRAAELRQLERDGALGGVVR